MKEDQTSMIMLVLFLTFWAVYVLTAIGTLGMLFFDFGAVKDTERTTLINVFLVESAVAISSLFFSVFGIKKKAENKKKNIGKEQSVTPLSKTQISFSGSDDKSYELNSLHKYYDDETIRLAKDLSLYSNGAHTILERPKQGEVSRIGYKHIVFGKGTVQSFFDRIPDKEILKMSTDMGASAATSLWSHIRAIKKKQAREILSKPKLVFELLSFWDDTGGWGGYETDTNGGSQWKIEIKNDFLSSTTIRGKDVVENFWKGYFGGFAKRYCEIRNEQYCDDHSRVPLSMDNTTCVINPMEDGYILDCRINFSL